MDKKVHSAGIVDYNSLTARPFGLRCFDLDFLAVTLEGEAFFMLESKGISSKVDPGNFVYVPAGQRHVYDPETNSKWRNCWVLFDGTAAVRSFERLMPAPGISAVKSTRKLAEYWDELSLSILGGNEMSDERSFCLLHNILLEIREQNVLFSQVRPSQAINDAIRLMENNIRNPEINYKHLANKNGICPDSLRKRFKRETGISLHQYFIQLKINAAKSMLSNLSYNISDLADFLGFKDQYYFSRLFKKKTGVSPLKYRNDISSKQKMNK
jgi:AraC-like DNA-binding protein